ncbi:MAG: hypothetical protein WC477_07405 [Patescibacteria group bacterium]
MKNSGSIAGTTGLEGEKRRTIRDVSNLLGPSEAKFRDGQGEANVANVGIPPEAVIARVDTEGIRAVRITASALNASGRIRVSACYGGTIGTIGSWAVPRLAAPADEGVSILIDFPGPMIIIEAVVFNVGAPLTNITASWKLYPFDVLEDQT